MFCIVLDIIYIFVLYLTSKSRLIKLNRIMKITVSINLGGYSFIINEDAYSELRMYLDNLEDHFSEDENSSEILSDIETRMAELFHIRLSDNKQVIDMEDTLYIMDTMLSGKATASLDK